MIAVDFGIGDTKEDEKVKITMIKILDLILQTTVKSDKVCDIIDPYKNKANQAT